MEYFDIVDEYGEPTGETVSRETAHRDGILHRTAHVWIVRQTNNGYEILLQKRSMEKDSYPGMYDTSSAGHIPAGDDPLESALRELQEELGIDAAPHQLIYAGMFHGQYAKEFHGKMFRDNEIARIYVYQEEVEIKDLKLQKSEVDEVRWFDLNEVWDAIFHQRGIFCVPTEGLRILRKFLGCRNRIGILSDTHGLLRDEVKAALGGFDMILHGGDIDNQEVLSQLQQIAPTIVVRGNNDKGWAKGIPDYLKISLDGLSVYMTHKKKDLPKDLSHYDLVVYGHSHRYEE